MNSNISVVFGEDQIAFQFSNNNLSWTDACVLVYHLNLLMVGQNF